MKKLSLFLVIFSLLTLLCLVGCQGEDATTSSNTQGTQASATMPTAPSDTATTTGADTSATTAVTTEAADAHDTGTSNSSATSTAKPTPNTTPKETVSVTTTTKQPATPVVTTAANLGGSNDSFGDDLNNSDIFNGYFEDESSDFSVVCVSGTANCYSFSNNTLTFTALNEDSVYTITGKLKGNIVIRVGDDYKLDLELQNFSLVSDTTTPITIESGKEVSLTAKKDSENYVYDNRDAIDKNNETLYSAAIYSLVDLEICGKGSLTVYSKNNNGIHTKDDLKVKNLTLFVTCCDNALKGNDSVEITSGKTTLIATQGDGIKTTNSHISEKENQRGTITISGGDITIYAACDGIDAAYDAIISGSDTSLTIYTDKYSNYSDEVTDTAKGDYYIRYNNKNYQYSIKYYNSDSDFVWVNATYHSSVSSGRNTYYYYTFPKQSEYSKMQLFVYSSGMQQENDVTYTACTEMMSPNESYDTIALSAQGSSFRFSWTNYTTSSQGGMGGFPGGMGGGMQEGNKDKGDHSTKGIKASNEICILDGKITIKSYDDAIHAGTDTSLENGAKSTGNINIQGGTLTLYSNDDGIHADGTLSVSSGIVTVTNAYEGLEGTTVRISGGNVSITSKDDGINATTSSGTAIEISGGFVYVHASGDGIDSNSRASYSGIVFSGGNTVVISNSNMNSAIDSEQGYAFTGGSVLALTSSGGMSSESTHCQNFSSIGTEKSSSVTSGSYLSVTVGGSVVACIQNPESFSAKIIYLGSKSATFTTSSSTDLPLDINGVYWAS